MKELGISVRFLRQRLEASFGETPVRQAPLPPELESDLAIVHKYISGFEDTSTTGGHRIVSQPLFEIVAVAPGDTMEVVYEASCLIDVAMYRETGQSAEGFVFSVIRQAPIQFAYVSDRGVLMQVMGGLYRLTVKAVSEIG